MLQLKQFESYINKKNGIKILAIQYKEGMINKVQNKAFVRTYNGKKSKPKEIKENDYIIKYSGLTLIKSKEEFEGMYKKAGVKELNKTPANKKKSKS